MSVSLISADDGLSAKMRVNGLDCLSIYPDMQFGFRNKIINGDMRIAQRGTSFPVAGNGSFAVDRLGKFQAGTVVVTTSQQASGPSGSGITTSARVEVTTADTSIAAGDFFILYHIIEGYGIRDLVGKTFTLSFYAKSSKTGVYCVSFRSSNSDRSYIAEYSIISTNTWEYKTITITNGLPVAGTWDFVNGTGLNIGFSLSCGSTFQTTPGAWQSGNFMGSVNQVNFTDTVGAIFDITGIQLELGPIATKFEQRPYGLELSLCQRYFQLCSAFNGKWQSSTTQFTGGVTFPVPMRAAPTVALVGTPAVHEYDFAFRNITAVPVNALGAYGGYMALTTAAAGAGSGGNFNGSLPTAGIFLSAEL